MKSISWLFLIVLLALSFMIVSCGNDDDDNDDFDPTNMAGVNADVADWIINITPIDNTDKVNDYMVMVVFTGDNTTIQASDQAVLKIDGSPLTWMSEMPGYYHTQTDLTPGQTYQMSFWFKNSEKASTSMKLPYNANANFPETFNPTSATSFDWTLGGNNQYQVAAAQSSKYVSTTEYYSDEYIKTISSSSRSFDVPANAIDTWGTGTTLTLALYQISYKNVDRIAFMAYQVIQRVY